MIGTRVFLMYHELALPGRVLCATDPGYQRYVVTASRFEHHLVHLRRHHVRTISVGEALTLGPKAPRAVVLTFDDGSETDFLVAAPLLETLGFSATFYVIAGFLDRPGYLTHTQLRCLSDMGFEIGSHSLTHVHLTDVPLTRLRDELAGSRASLEDVIGREVRHFSCPGGRWSARIAHEANNAGYRSVATSHPGLNFSTSDTFRLARVPVTRDVTIDGLHELCTGRHFALLRGKYIALSLAKWFLGNRRYEAVRACLLHRAAYHD